MSSSAVPDDEAVPRPRWATPVEVLAVALFTAWIAWPFVAPGGYVTDFDTVTYSGPTLAATFRAWDEGRLPLWEPGIFGGTAFAANLQTAVFYPLKLLFWPLGVPAALGWLTATHLFVLAAGMWWLARRTLRLAPPAGLVAAVVLVGSGTTMVRSVRFEQIAVVAWIPWLLVAIDALVAAPAGRRRRPVAAVAVAVALVLLSGHPNQAMIGAALAALWTVVRVLDRQPDGRRAVLGWVAAGAGLGTGIAALPLVLAVPLASRLSIPPGVMLDQAAQDRNTLWPARLVTGFLGDAVTAAAPAERPTFEHPAFVGAAALLLAVVGAVAWCAGADRRNRATGWGLLAAAGVSVVLALGPAFGLYRLAAAVVPGFGNGRVPLRWLLIPTVAVALLAAAGVSELVRRGMRRSGVDGGRGATANNARTGASGGTAVRAVLIAAAVIALAALAPPWGEGAPTAGARIGWLVAAALVLAALRGAGRPVAPDPAGLRAALLIAAVIVIELALPARVSYGRALREGRSFADRATAVDAFLVDQGDRALVLGRSDVNANLTAGWRTLDGYDGGLWLSQGYVDLAERLSDGSFWVIERLGEHITIPLDPDELAEVGVRYAVYDPRFAHAARDELLAGWTGPVATDGSREVWENPRYRGEARLVDAPPGSEAPTVHRPEPGVIEVSTADPSPGGRLAVTEQALPGWTATVDGGPVPLVEVDVDGFALGVDLPAGAHTVRFAYEPPGFWLGTAISLGCLVVALGLALWPQRPMRRDAGTSSGATARSGTNTT